MPDSSNKVYSLEELNRQYARRVKNIPKKKRTQGRWLIFAMIILVVIVLGGVILGIRFMNNVLSDPDESFNMAVDSILTEEEQADWKQGKIDRQKVYIELNSEIEVEDKKAAIRLTNPIYSEYTMSIQICARDDDSKVFYQSEKLSPGTVLECAMFKEEIEADCDAVVRYIVYDTDGNDKGTYPVYVKLLHK